MPRPIARVRARALSFARARARAHAHEKRVLNRSILFSSNALARDRDRVRRTHTRVANPFADRDRRSRARSIDRSIDDARARAIECVLRKATRSIASRSRDDRAFFLCAFRSVSRVVVRRDDIDRSIRFDSIDRTASPRTIGVTARDAERARAPRAARWRIR